MCRREQTSPQQTIVPALLIIINAVSPSHSATNHLHSSFGIYFHMKILRKNPGIKCIQDATTSFPHTMSVLGQGTSVSYQL